MAEHPPGWPFQHPYGEHDTIIGSTGAGKTTMVKSAVLPRRRRFIICDSKARVDGTSIDFTEPAFVKCNVKTAVKFSAGDKNFRLRIPIASGDEGFDQIEELSEQLLAKGGHHTYVYLDEVTDFSDAFSIGPRLEGLIRKGRGYKISVGVGSQKPKGVNGWFADNSAHFYLFGMKPADQVRFVRNTGREWVAQVQPKIPIGSFKFAHEDWQGNVTIFKPVPLFDWSRVKA